MQIEHSAKNALVALGKKYPEMGRIVDAMAFGERPSGIEVPGEYLLPKHVWRGICTYLNHMTPEEFKANATVMNNRTEELRFLGTWAKTQGIYRFDKDIYAELLESPLEGDLPAVLLRKLPEWCIYIETPGLQLMEGRGCRGVWVMNDYAMDSEESVYELSIMFDPELPPGVNMPMVSTVSLPLGQWTLESVMQKYRNASLSTLEHPMVGQLGIKSDMFEVHAMVDDLTRITRQVLSLTLYIATQNDLTGDLKGSRPERPEPQRNKRGVRLYGPSTPKVWEVGVRMGSELRRAKEQSVSTGESGGGTVRPHIRKPHWHSFRTGPMKTAQGELIPAGERDLVVHFIPSLQVNFTPETTREGLPAVVHPVRGGRQRKAEEPGGPAR